MRKFKGSRGCGGPTHVALSSNLRLDVARTGQTTYIKLNQPVAQFNLNKILVEFQTQSLALYVC